MKKISTYIPSLILSVLLVFTFIGGSALIIADININSKRFASLADKKDLDSKVYSELEKHYQEKYHSTGIPADVYMNSLTTEYLNSVIKAYFDTAFESLDSGKKFESETIIPKNESLEKSIDTFFSDFAESSDYWNTTDNEEYEKKLANYEKIISATKENAYKTIGDSCDVYKFSAMSKHGVLSKLSKLYRHRALFTGLITGFAAVIIILLFVINRKDKKAIPYWCGVSFLISGIIGAVPSLYLIATKYFDAFSVKQPQIFTAYTTSMYALTEAFMASHIAFIVIGVSMIVIYVVLRGKDRLANDKIKEK